MNKARKILIAEDEKPLLNVLSHKLTSAGFEVLQAMNGDKCLEQVKKDLPDLVLLDIMMPHKNGFEVLQEMKADPKTKNIPVVVFSNLGKESDIERAMKYGAADFFVKSNISVSEIVQIVEKYLQKK